MVGFFVAKFIDQALFLQLHIATVQDYENGEDIQVLRSKYQEATRDNDTNRVVVWAGIGVGDMNDIKPAKVIIAFHGTESFSDFLLFNRSSFKSCNKSV